MIPTVFVEIFTYSIWFGSAFLYWSVLGWTAAMIDRIYRQRVHYYWMG